jgi:two-component system, NtrC family, response regulator AtoC
LAYRAFDLHTPPDMGVIGSIRPPGEDGAEEGGAFVVVRFDDETFVVDLRVGIPLVLGSAADAGVRLRTEGVLPRHAIVLWDGETVTVRNEGGDGLFVGGKKAVGTVEVEPGDEIALGGAQVVVGIAAPFIAGGRRTFTHHEFCERLHEEIARAARGNRPTAVIMVRTRSGEGGRVSAAALDSFRAGDVVANYAPDEPEFLLPDADAETADTVVRRILDGLETEAMVGIAIAPTDGDTAERMIRAARQALADAMRAGRTDRTYRAPALSSEVDEPLALDLHTRHVLDEARYLAATDEPVLVTGEGSTGKGLFARMIHQNSARSDGPLILIHCATVDDAGAIDRAFGPADAPGGQLLEASSGTLVLDEVGDLDPPAQERLLRALEVAGDEVRVISTTQRALGGLVERGAFDSDLYERLCGKILELPALRNRKEDILPLAIRFAEEAGMRRPARLSAAAIARLRSYPWPGNVLELKNAMERAVRLAGDAEILGEFLPSEPVPITPSKGRLREHVDGVERDAIIKALADSNHNQTHAARRLGVSRRALIYKMEKYGLKAPPGSKR